VGVREEPMVIEDLADFENHFEKGCMFNQVEYSVLEEDDRHPALLCKKWC
jgi:hypothetical protein